MAAEIMPGMPAARTSPLRLEAEAQAQRSPPEALSPASLEAALHELRVHRIELEMQNDELRRSQLALEAARDRYRDLYDFAPVGYLTLNPLGQIVDINLTACLRFGIDRRNLIGQPLSEFIGAVDADRWSSHFLSLQHNHRRQRIELALTYGNGSLFQAQLDCVPALALDGGGPTYRVAVVEDVTSYTQAMARIVGHSAQLAALSGRLLLAQEEERRHVARELHDELGQVLTAVQLALAPLTRVASSVLDQGLVSDAKDIVQQAMQRVRRVWTGLRPPALAELGLESALHSLLEQHARRTGMTVMFRGQDACTAPPALGEALYRVAQEALTNAARHSSASEVELQLATLDGLLRLQIRDNGSGFDTAAYPGDDHLGVVGMRERLRLVDGRLKIVSTPGQGTEVIAEVPLAQAAA